MPNKKQESNKSNYGVNEIQKTANQYCSKNNIPKINIIFSNRNLGKGRAYYETFRYKTSEKHIPKNIIIGEWNLISDYPDEWIEALAHELAHHEINAKKNLLTHSQEHNKTTHKILSFLNESKRLYDKIFFWETNKKKICNNYKDVAKFDYDNELKKMKDKLKNL